MEAKSRPNDLYWHHTTEHYCPECDGDHVFVIFHETPHHIHQCTTCQFQFKEERYEEKVEYKRIDDAE